MTEEKIVYVCPKVETCGKAYCVDYVIKTEWGIKTEYFKFDFLYQAEEKLAELTLQVGG